MSYKKTKGGKGSIIQENWRGGSREAPYYNHHFIMSTLTSVFVYVDRKNPIETLTSVFVYVDRKNPIETMMCQQVLTQLYSFVQWWYLWISSISNLHYQPDKTTALKMHTIVCMRVSLSTTVNCGMYHLASGECFLLPLSSCTYSDRYTDRQNQL